MNEFLVLPGHHLYKMDYQKIIEAHRNSKAGMTIAALSARREQDPDFGLLRLNSENRVLEFRLKSDSEPITFVSVGFHPSSTLLKFYSFWGSSLRKFNSEIQEESPMKFGDIAYGKFSSMGIYLINRDIMVKLLREHFPKANDFKSEVIPGAISLGMKVRLILYAPYHVAFLFKCGSSIFFLSLHNDAVLVIYLFNCN